jgi:NADH:ubiquinone oxidoreductase subunit K
MKMLVTSVLTVILFIIGIITVVFNASNPLAISFGMFLVAVSILNIAVQIYFPQQPRGTVELKVVNVKTVEKPKKASKSRKRKKK